MTNCDEPVHADLVLKTLKNRRDFHNLKWYGKVMRMNDKRLPFKSLSNDWDKVKYKGHPKRSWLAQVDSLRKQLNLQDKVLDIELIKKIH